MHELVGAQLSFSGKVGIGEMVAVKALMGSTVIGAIEDGKEGHGKRPMCTSLEARPVAALAEFLYDRRIRRGKGLHPSHVGVRCKP